MTLLAEKVDLLMAVQPCELRGRVVAVRGLTVIAEGLRLPIGTLVRIVHTNSSANANIRGEVIGFENSRAIIMLLDACTGLKPGATVAATGNGDHIRVGDGLLGRIINGLGDAIDGKGRIRTNQLQPLHVAPTSALHRRRITEPLATGVRSVDSMLTLGKGQRIGIFSGAGVGKSTLMGSIARNTAADVNVVGLIGERGREVRDFIADALGESGLRRTVLVVATGDESAALRVRATLVACAVAEHFRDQGADVMLMIDSITRFAQAQRQIGLASGEQPATKGYTPSVFAMLPAILERAGAVNGRGSITGLYAVLVEGDDLNEPISDAARGVLDGHIVLSRQLATRGHFPAIQVLDSISRVADDVCDENHQTARRQVIRLLAAYREAEELINIGAYARGSNPYCDVAISMKSAIDQYLQQRKDEQSSYPQTCRSLLELAAASQQEMMKLTKASANSVKAARK